MVTALKMPKQTEEHRSARQEAIQKATKEAAIVPMETLRILAELTGLVRRNPISKEILIASPMRA